MTAHQMTMQLANSLPMWIFCISTIGLVFVQAGIFVWLGKRYSSTVGITKIDVSRSVKAGFISTLGPVFSIFVVGLGLIAQIGAPMTLARLSVIGNVIYETSAAEMGAAAMGTSIGSDSYSMAAFVCSVWVMNLGGICMILPSILLIKPFSKVTQKVKEKKGLGLVIASSVSISSIGYFVAESSMSSNANFLAAVTAFLSIIGLNYASTRFKLNWLKEWAMAIAILAAVVIVMLFSSGG